MNTVEFYGGPLDGERRAIPSEHALMLEYLVPESLPPELNVTHDEAEVFVTLSYRRTSKHRFSYVNPWKY